MKIIAKSGPRNYILEASSEEIDKLAGTLICKDKYGQEGELIYVVGAKFNILKAFDQIHRNDQRKREIETLRATLNAMLVGLDMIGPLIEETKVEETEPAA
jgi:hypothetical protein